MTNRELAAVSRRLDQFLSDLIDETSFPKAGDASVGVARQYCGALGKFLKTSNTRARTNWPWG